jgi:autotransporter-associated beta strand protein
MKFRTRHLAGSTLSILAAATLAVGSANAANKTWDGEGADDFWLTGGNWDADTAPSALDLLIFDGVTRLTPDNNFSAGTQFNGITFNAGAGAFTLGGNGIVLGTPLTGVPSSGNITNSSSSLQTINLGVTLGNGNHAINGGGSGLALNPSGGLQRDPGGVVNFSGTVSTTTISNGPSGIVGGWATFGTGTTINWATNNGGNLEAYSAYTDVSPGGTIASDPTANVRAITGGSAITMAAAGTTNINTLAYSVTGTAQTIDIGAGNTLRLGVEGGILRTTTSSASATNQLVIPGNSGAKLTAGGDTIDTPGTIFINTVRTASGSGTDLQITTEIIDNGDGAVTVVKAGRGYAQINPIAGMSDDDPPVAIPGSNTYSGGTYINEGRLQASTTEGNLPYGTGSVTVQSGGQAFFGGSGAPNDFFIAGIGPQNEAGTGAIRGGGVISGMVTLIGDARISGKPTITGQITGNYSLDLGSSGSIGSTPSTDLTLSNPSNDWSGNTSIIGRTGGSAGHTVVNLGADEVIPHGAGKGNVILSNATVSTTTLNLNGRNETINGLASGAGTATLGFVQNNADGTTSLLTLGAGDATATFGGTIRDNAGGLATGIVALTKIGTGTQTLTGANSYTGDTTILDGTLSISNPFLADTSNVWLETGALFTLNFAGIDTIQFLYFNGVQQAGGTWGATGSGAEFESSFFSGTGMLAAVPEPSHYALGVAGLLALVVLMRRRHGALGLR